MKKIILITGPMYSGKTTIADMLHQFGFKKFSFASSLKDIAKNTYSLDGSCINKASNYTIYDKNSNSNIQVSGRKLLQGLSEAIKSFDYSFFYRTAFTDVTKSGESFVVFDDCRFEEEYTYILENIGKDCIMLLKVSARQEDRMNRAMERDGKVPTIEEQSAPSEVFDWVSKYEHVTIENSNTLDSLNSVIISSQVLRDFLK